MKTIAWLILLPTLMLAGLASAQFSLPETMPELPSGTVVCNKGGTVCLVNAKDLAAIRHEVDVQFTTSKIMEGIIRDQQYVIEKLLADQKKRCTAILEVVPKGHNTGLWM